MIDGLIRRADNAATRRPRVPVLFLVLVLSCISALPSLAAEPGPRISAWQTETIPHAPPPAAALPPPAPTPTPPGRQLTVFEQQAAETIKITNDFRRRNGLPEFKEDPVCTAAAFDHAQDMARQSYFNHFGPGGTSPTSRYKRRNVTGQRVIRVTENIARGNGTTPESALRMWLDSSGHRKHLVGREMNHIGVGVANGTCFFAACTYFVQCFSRWP